MSGSQQTLISDACIASLPENAVLQLSKAAEVVFGGHFYLELFSVLEQTHCAHDACDSKGMTTFKKKL